MRINKALWWAALTSIQGFEDEGISPVESGDGNTDGVEGGGDETEEAGNEQPPAEEDPAAGLKSALQKERSERRALQKELAKFQKEQKAREDSEKSEVERLSDLSGQQSQRLQKLSDAFRESAIERAVLSAARTAKFTDPTDALRREVLSAIQVEQDEDDPTQVEIDEASVTQAVQALAKSKPHYLTSGEQQTPPPGSRRSASKFGGTGNQKKGTDRDRLGGLYPALNNF
ncbi:hypothetical protein ACWIG4_30165 [Streptomyces sp. NPDC002248]